MPAKILAHSCSMLSVPHACWLQRHAAAARDSAWDLERLADRPSKDALGPGLTPSAASNGPMLGHPGLQHDCLAEATDQQEQEQGVGTVPDCNGGTEHFGGREQEMYLRERTSNREIRRCAACADRAWKWGARLVSAASMFVCRYTSRMRPRFRCAVRSSTATIRLPGEAHTRIKSSGDGILRMHDQQPGCRPARPRSQTMHGWQYRWQSRLTSSLVSVWRYT